NNREQISTQAVAAGPSPTGACVFARTHGTNFVVVERNGSQKLHRYVEAIPEPKVVVKRKTVERTGNSSVVQETQLTESTAAAMRAIVVQDTLIVLFAGATNFKYRL